MARMFNWLSKASTAQSILGGTTLNISGGASTSKADIYNGIAFTEDGHIISHGIDFFSVSDVVVNSTTVTKGNAALKALIDAANTTYTFSVSNDTITITPSVGGVAKIAQTLTISGVKNATTQAALTLQIQGTTKNTFNGSSAQTFNVTRSGLGLTSGSGDSEKILTTLLPFSTAVPSSEDNTILSNFAIRQLIATAKSEAMRYKGTFSTTTLPTPDQVGDTYKYAGTANAKVTINSKTVTLEPGDTIICESITESSTKTYTWSVIQTNTNVITSNINGTNQQVYGLGTGFTIYAPTTAGTAGQILTSTAGTPTWQTVSVSNTIGNTGTLVTTVKVGSNSFASSSVNIIANKVQQKLTFDSGLAATATTYDGSVANTIKVALVDYTKNTNASATDSTSFRAVTLDSNGKLATDLSSYFTNVYFGTTSNANYSASVSATSVSSTSPGYLIFGNGTNAAKKYIKFYGTSGISIGHTDSEITISGSLATSTSKGVVPQLLTAINSDTPEATNSYVVLTSDANSNMIWQKLPSNAFSNTNTWREIQVGGTTLLSSSTTTGVLNFAGSTNVSVSGKSNTITITASNRDVQINGNAYLAGTAHDTLNFVNGTHTTVKSVTSGLAINATWRPISVEGITKLTSTDSVTLNFVASEAIYPIMDSNNQLGFDLMWFNIDTGTYERI